MDEEVIRNNIEKIIEQSIDNIIKIIQKHPYYFVNEEDIRCELYNRLSNVNHKLFFQNSATREIFLSNALHANANVGGKYPDLLIYYAKNGRNNPIPTDNVDEVYKKDIINFFSSSPINKDNNHKRVFIEITYINHKKGISSGRKTKIKKDINKSKGWDCWKRYILFLDMSNQLYEEQRFMTEITELMMKNTDGLQSEVDFIYVGFPVKERNKKGQYLHMKNGKEYKKTQWQYENL